MGCINGANMEKAVFHIFLNSPVGRENLLQSAYLAERLQPRSLTVFLPTHDQCAMYCNDTVLTLNLDASYLRFPETARDRVRRALEGFRVEYDFYEPTGFTGGSIPEVPDDWAIMACPRVISQKSGRIGLGHIGPKVRSILSQAQFPLLIPSGSFHPWRRVAVLFGGPDHGPIVTIAEQLAQRAQLPLEILTQLGNSSRKQCEATLTDLNIKQRIDDGQIVWRIFESGTLEENLYEVPRDSLVVVGTGKRRLVQELLFGTTLEKIQELLPNPLLVCGPRCRPELPC
jgi:hypothetical protein